VIDPYPNVCYNLPMSITQRWHDLRREIQSLSPRPIEVCAVTKTRPAEDIREIVAAGARVLGENRVEEAIRKFQSGGLKTELPGTALHMIGHLQTRKVRDAVALFDCIQSVDSTKLAREISKRCEAAERVMDVLIEVNVSGEEQKYGVQVTDAAQLVEYAQSLPAVRLQGLMTMAPYTDDEQVLRATFRGLRELRDGLVTQHGEACFTVLSMGMTNDYRIALEEGSTMLRLGSYLFTAGE
jgi:pyridoxal phosphate enzyme (YggS family)